MPTESVVAAHGRIRAFIEGSIDLGALDDWLADHASQSRSEEERRLEAEAAHLLAWWDDGVYGEDDLRREFAKLLDEPAAQPSRAVRPRPAKRVSRREDTQVPVRT